MIIDNARVFWEAGGFVRQKIITEDGIISECTHDNSGFDASGMYILPGLVDIHLHGALGYDFSDHTKEALLAIEKYETDNGITTYLPALMTLPKEELNAAASLARDMITPESSISGINLEGPFLSPDRCGAQDRRNILPPDISVFNDIMQSSCGNIKLVTVAPEMPGADDFIKEVSHLTTVSIGHTAADYNTALHAFRCGACHVTHLYNAMNDLLHRSPGVAAASFDEGAFVEIIADGNHVDPAVIRMTFALYGDRTVLISDSMRGTGLGDGMYTLGGQDVIKKGSRAFLASDESVLAGSVCNLADMLQNAVKFGVDADSAVKAATINPAKSVGLEKEAGVLSIGRRADLLFTSEDFTPLYVMKNGKMKKV